MAKNFKTNNPAAMFVPTEPEKDTEATIPTFATTDITPTDTKTDTESINQKNDRTGKRFNLSLYSQDTLQDLKILAMAQQTSVNQLINDILTEYTATHAEELKRYREFFKK